jgi:restriction system protein
VETVRRFVGSVLQGNGHTSLGADGGIDIKLFQDDSEVPTAIVQCKAWNSKLVGVKPIREFLGVMSHEKISKGFFMASGVYSDDAKEIANANGITLINGVMFLAMIKHLSEDAQLRLLSLVTSGEFTTPSCPSCGIKLVRRTSKRGDFWGCQNYPKCRQMLNMTKIHQGSKNEEFTSSAVTS